MYPRKLFVVFRRTLRQQPILQVGLILTLWLAGQSLVRWSGLPIPAGIIGMILALVLLASGWLAPASLRQGANWLIAEMLLFFVPAVLAILDHREFLGIVGLKLLAAILMGTILVMVVTAVSVEVCFRLMHTSERNEYAGD